MKKVVLAYNGSLDSTLCIHWLKEHNDMEVVALVADLDIVTQFDDLAEQALECGAISTVFKDLTDEFCNNHIKNSLFANMATVENDPLATALARPVICKAMVDTAEEYGTEFLAHGCKPGSDDSTRFETCLTTLAPQMKIVEPLKEWNLKTKEQKLEYARNHNMQLVIDYSLDDRSGDKNIWGNIVYRKSLDDTWTSSIQKERVTAPLAETSDTPQQLVLEFKQGVPVSMNNKKMHFKDILHQLNETGKIHGIGYVDMVGHKIKGLKTRKVVECPGATILTRAHEALEYLTLDRELLEFKRNNVLAYRKIVTQGFWYTQFREVLDASFKQTQTYVTGEVRLELFRGQVTILGRRSPHALNVESAENMGLSTLKVMRPSAPRKKR